MNNNRNNRRRGRGNRSQGGGSSGNRIDSRARGNAPQLLDKYKKLAQDAQHNGDRVQQEYYLQFADHYFRVLADNKSRQDEARGGRRDDERQSGDEDFDENEFDYGNDDRRMSRPARPRRADDSDGDERSAQRPRRGRPRDDENGSGDEREPGDNPFLANGEAPAPVQASAPRPRRTARKPRQSEQGPAGSEGEIDHAVLPPAIGASDGESMRPAPRSRRRKQDDDAEVGAVG